MQIAVVVSVSKFLNKVSDFVLNHHLPLPESYSPLIPLYVYSTSMIRITNKQCKVNTLALTLHCLCYFIVSNCYKYIFSVPEKEFVYYIQRKKTYKKAAKAVDILGSRLNSKYFLQFLFQRYIMNSILKITITPITTIVHPIGTATSIDSLSFRSVIPTYAKPNHQKANQPSKMLTKTWHTFLKQVNTLSFITPLPSINGIRKKRLFVTCKGERYIKK